MSRLTVFWPEDAKLPLAAEESPAIVAFPRSVHATNDPVAPMNVATRARLMYQNRRCFDCGYPVVEPIELSDSATNLSGMSIPGTATLIGFRCRGCKHEWSI